MKRYFLKQNRAEFVINDGHYKGNSFRHGIGYLAVPMQYVELFDEVEIKPDVKVFGRPAASGAGKRRDKK